jgi:hypothetical protein
MLCKEKEKTKGLSKKVGPITKLIILSVLVLLIIGSSIFAIKIYKKHNSFKDDIANLKVHAEQLERDQIKIYQLVKEEEAKIENLKREQEKMASFSLALQKKTALLKRRLNDSLKTYDDVKGAYEETRKRLEEKLTYGQYLIKKINEAKEVLFKKEASLKRSMISKSEPNDIKLECRDKYVLKTDRLSYAEIVGKIIRFQLIRQGSFQFDKNLYRQLIISIITILKIPIHKHISVTLSELIERHPYRPSQCKFSQLIEVVKNLIATYTSNNKLFELLC